LAAGIAIGITGDAGVRATAQQPRMFVGMVKYRKGQVYDQVTNAFLQLVDDRS
jgi:hypothetical protein